MLAGGGCIPSISLLRKAIPRLDKPADLMIEAGLRLELPRIGGRRRSAIRCLPLLAERYDGSRDPHHTLTNPVSSRNHVAAVQGPQHPRLPHRGRRRGRTIARNNVIRCAAAQRLPSRQSRRGPLPSHGRRHLDLLMVSITSRRASRGRRLRREPYPAEHRPPRTSSTSRRFRHDLLGYARRWGGGEVITDAGDRPTRLKRQRGALPRDGHRRHFRIRRYIANTPSTRRSAHFIAEHVGSVPSGNTPISSSGPPAFFGVQAEMVLKFGTHRGVG